MFTYICRQWLVFPYNSHTPYKAKNWQALLHQQYFPKHRFLDIFL